VILFSGGASVFGAGLVLVFIFLSSLAIIFPNAALRDQFDVPLNFHPVAKPTIADLPASPRQKNPVGLGNEFCAICANISLAGDARRSEAPTLPAEIPFFKELHWSFAAAQARSIDAPFFPIIVSNGTGPNWCKVCPDMFGAMGRAAAVYALTAVGSAAAVYALTAVGSPAAAADLLNSMPLKTPPFASYDSGGFYFGGHVGYVVVNSDWTTMSTGGGGPLLSGSADIFDRDGPWGPMVGGL
jgi:hypothetical protein